MTIEAMRCPYCGEADAGYCAVVGEKWVYDCRSCGHQARGEVNPPPPPPKAGKGARKSGRIARAA